METPPKLPRKRPKRTEIKILIFSFDPTRMVEAQNPREKS